MQENDTNSLKIIKKMSEYLHISFLLSIFAAVNVHGRGILKCTIIKILVRPENVDQKTEFERTFIEVFTVLFPPPKMYDY